MSKVKKDHHERPSTGSEQSTAPKDYDRRGFIGSLSKWSAVVAGGLIGAPLLSSTGGCLDSYSDSGYSRSGGYSDTPYSDTPYSDTPYGDTPYSEYCDACGCYSESYGNYPDYCEFECSDHFVECGETYCNYANYSDGYC